jgi:cyanophycinase
MGYLLLEGGAEFGGKMSLPDRQAIELAGGPDAPICIIPTAAAPDKNHARAGYNGLRWFQGLGARDVKSLPLIDKASAEDGEIAGALRKAKLIYLLGGFTAYLGKTLKLSLAWEAALEAYRDGAVIAGSSAGAMVLCQFYYDPEKDEVADGLNLVRNACLLPHHNTFGKGWASRLLSVLPGVTLLGVDESTGMLDDGHGEHWSVLGGGTVTVYSGDETRVYRAGESFSIR